MWTIVHKAFLLFLFKDLGAPREDNLLYAAKEERDIAAPAAAMMFRPGPEAAKPRFFGSASRAQAEPTFGLEPAFGSAWHSSKPRPSRKAAAFAPLQGIYKRLKVVQYMAKRVSGVRCVCRTTKEARGSEKHSGGQKLFRLCREEAEAAITARHH
ncbi:hypothetical protein K438DRAFT_1777821 [Mycena galopus ATCC 62051]|nr:hypothetical protein K438DRAFT_1777821 [Mycena galopus ATCC 62051]